MDSIRRSRCQIPGSMFGREEWKRLLFFDQTMFTASYHRCLQTECVTSPFSNHSMEEHGFSRSSSSKPRGFELEEVWEQQMPSSCYNTKRRSMCTRRHFELASLWLQVWKTMQLKAMFLSHPRHTLQHNFCVHVISMDVSGFFFFFEIAVMH